MPCLSPLAALLAVAALLASLGAAQTLPIVPGDYTVEVQTTSRVEAINCTVELASDLSQLRAFRQTTCCGQPAVQSWHFFPSSGSQGQAGEKCLNVVGGQCLCVPWPFAPPRNNTPYCGHPKYVGESYVDKQLVRGWQLLW